MNKTLILRHFSKVLTLSTAFLIFAGGLVTSTGSGLSVPDWPLSYGMVFPPMVGGVFYEHGHRMIASVVGLMTLCLTIMIALWEKRTWLKILGFVALTAVIIQGILGGLTVKFFLPLPISVSHGVLAQSFFVLTIIIAYSLSHEREQRYGETPTHDALFLKLNIFFAAFVIFQLVIGAIMRHMHAGLALLDFPQLGGAWWPNLSPEFIEKLNNQRFDLNLDPVNRTQIFYHIFHRLNANILFLVCLLLNYIGFKKSKLPESVKQTLLCLDLLLLIQIILGITTIFSHKEYHIASLHVVMGAIVLGWSILLFLRAAPVKFQDLKNLIIK